MNYYKKCIQNYITFSGRARRTEYWGFVLINFIAGVVLGTIATIRGEETFGLFRVLSLLYSLFVLLPGISVGVRRLHDTNRSGGWIFINFIPVIGFIWFIVLMFLDSDLEENQYGKNPKIEEIEATAGKNNMESI